MRLVFSISSLLFFLLSSMLLLLSSCLFFLLLGFLILDCLLLLFLLFSSLILFGVFLGLGFVLLSEFFLLVFGNISLRITFLISSYTKIRKMKSIMFTIDIFSLFSGISVINNNFFLFVVFCTSVSLILFLGWHVS